MNFEDFRTYASTFSIVPVYKVLMADTLTPVSAYLNLRGGTSGSFLFESVEGGERIARYSFIGRDPKTIVSCRGLVTTISDSDAGAESNENFFEVLSRLVSTRRSPKIPSLPRFTGGLVGCIGYDAIRFIENIPARAPSQINIPDSILGIFTSIIAFDHVKHQVIIIVNVEINSETSREKQYVDAMSEIDRMEELLFHPSAESTAFHSNPSTLQHETDQQTFMHSVERAKQYIRDGDIFQVVLSQRFSNTFEGDSFNVYRALRVLNPSPYLYYLAFGEIRIIGSSPEILVRVEDGLADVYPIAGTRARGTTAREDELLEKELLADDKERAEHVMLVDLGRNDLGRVCTVGSVRVDQFMSVVRYSHVMHIASRVVGSPAPGKNTLDVLRATFPAGTVSGAPKIRAMEIIDELEPSQRGIYAGGIGYLDFSGTIDMCIAIRTMITAGHRLYFQAGAGIVADSEPEREYLETINKARVLVEALRMAEGQMR